MLEGGVALRCWINDKRKRNEKENKLESRMRKVIFAFQTQENQLARVGRFAINQGQQVTSRTSALLLCSLVQLISVVATTTWRGKKQKENALLFRERPPFVRGKCGEEMKGKNATEQS